MVTSTTTYKNLIFDFAENNNNYNLIIIFSSFKIWKKNLKKITKIYNFMTNSYSIKNGGNFSKLNGFAAQFFCFTPKECEAKLSTSIGEKCKHTKPSSMIPRAKQAKCGCKIMLCLTLKALYSFLYTFLLEFWKW